MGEAVSHWLRRFVAWARRLFARGTVDDSLTDEDGDDLTVW